MIGRLRGETRVQRQRDLVFRKKAWKGGECSDLPASEIGEDEVALLENAIAFPEYVEGRGGSKRFSDTALPGSGTIYLDIQHPTTKKYLLHRGSALYVGNADKTTWTEVTLWSNDGPTVVIAGDASSQIGVGISIYHASTLNTNNGVLYWELTNSGSVRTFSIYKDVAKLQLVGRASRTGNGFANIIPQNDSGLYGRMEITYVGDDTTAGNTLTLTLNANPWISPAYTEARPYENDFVIFNRDAIGMTLWHISLANNKARCLNWSIPDQAVVGSGAQSAATPYGYRYLFTFSRIEDPATGLGAPNLNRITGSLVHESPPYREISSQTGGYGESWLANPISNSNPNTLQFTDDGTVDDEGLNRATTIEPGDTHISIYRTLDIGAAGVDPVTGSGNNPEIYVWVADMEIGKITYSDEKTDESMRADFYGGFGLKNRFWDNIPSSDIGEITPTFFYAAQRGAQFVYYGQLNDKQFLGTYNPVFQFFRLDDGVQAIVKSPDMVTIICAGRTYITSPNSYTNASQIESVFVLNHITVVDESLGVTDWGSIAQIEAGVFIAHCSDHSIRVWNGFNWGKDISSRLVNKIVRQMVAGSVGGYFAGAFYLWYRTDSGQSYNNLCLRFGFGRDNGFGWSRMTGAAWVYPPLFVGCRLIQDSNSIQRLLVLDSPGAAFYWIETFDSYTGSGLSKVYTDKVTTAGVAGSAIVGKVRLREYVGPEENATLYHQETFVSLRPSAAAYPAGFASSMIGYADGVATPVETVSELIRDGDWQFWGKVEGKRIQLEFNFATSGWQMPKVKSLVQAQDKASIGKGPSSTPEASSQAALAGTGLKHWLTRPKNLLNRANGRSYTLTGTAPTNVTGPDGKTYALSFVTGASYSIADTTSYGDFSLILWISGVTVGNRLVVITGSNSFYLTLTNNTTLNVNGAGNVTLNSVAAGWHQIAAVRSGSTVSIYQNGVLMGTVAVATARGGTSVTLNPDAVAMILAEFRLLNTVLAAADVLYNYTDINANTGAKVLPLV